MHFFDLLLLIFFGLLLWLWQDFTRTKELATQEGWRACERGGVEFLDETVEFTKLAIRRNAMGRLGLRRVYRFEFCTDGSRRYQGEITMMGHRLERLDMEPYPENHEPPTTLH